MIIIVKCPNEDSYLENYGPHFNKNLSEFAVSLMCHSNKESLTLEEIMTILDKYKIKLDSKYLYDIYYTANMGYHDFYKSSIKDEEHLALFIKDYLEDEDGYEGIAFYRWLTDMKHKSVKINWNG